ncbi:MAG: DUF4199 domain-containing protein [Cyclobacteriaceae bacterium]|nr:DUF4199 domain-containing protein [Cyclobacteriaceae bacterium]
MKKIILIYGLISGAIVSAMMFATIGMVEKGETMKNGEIIGYTTMIIASSLIFFGIKSYRDNHLNGIITFLNAARIGILIALIGALMYALSWEVIYSRTGEEFTKVMMEKRFEEIEKSGASPKEIEETKKQWESFGEMYKNPLIRFGITLMEILPVGIIFTLLSAALLKQKNFLRKTPLPINT